ncbi:CalY family protein [Neobacillus sp. CF12]|uniref:CalY family protein n=1 Tax=Neobacillus sp. CF12 TaxID=3055864 RepID=UPI0025A2D481|nr:CalY family protein [Neobacillus sp. CF12]MDM5331341.1 CalY family protein [Neobacillus sp. CF12]
MSIKKKLGLGIASAAMGLALIGGGTYAYFNDTAVTNAKFANGILDLNAAPTTIIDVKNLKPGDWMNRTFTLSNDGTLDISRVLLSTEYTVTNKAGAAINTDDLGKHIRVNFLFNDDKALLGPISPDQVIYQTTLEQLKGMSPDAVSNAVFIPWLEEVGGLKAGDDDKLYVQFEFVDNGLDQNQFQGDSLELKWTFDGKQTAGQSR